MRLFDTSGPIVDDWRLTTERRLAVDGARSCPSLEGDKPKGLALLPAEDVETFLS